MAINLQEIQKVQDTLNNVDLVVATKYATVEDLYNLEKAGIKIFGENRVQAFLEKYEEYKGEAIWHIIGTLQTNKVKYIIDKVKMIHSVNSLSLADEIQKQCVKNNLTMPILLQVNIANEETKHGFCETQVCEVVNYILENCKNIQLRGFMMMAPKGDEEEIRIFFRKMKAVFDKIATTYPDQQIDTLSMGMSCDYKTAVEEGSTMVRIGRAFFIL